MGRRIVILDCVSMKIFKISGPADGALTCDCHAMHMRIRATNMRAHAIDMRTRAVTRDQRADTCDHMRSRIRFRRKTNELARNKTTLPRKIPALRNSARREFRRGFSRRTGAAQARFSPKRESIWAKEMARYIYIYRVVLGYR